MQLKRVKTTSGYKVCPQCGKEIKLQAVKCRYCQTGLKTCLYCAEDIQVQAIKCKYCQTDLRTTSKEGSVFRANEPVKANRRLIVLCLILVLLVIVLLNRWDIWWDVDRMTVYTHDRLTSLMFAQVTILEKIYLVQNFYISLAVSVILYALIGGVVIALFKETNSTKQQPGSVANNVGC